MTSLSQLLATGEEVTDPEEEAFLLFSQDIPTSNLGFVNARATTLDLTIRGNEYTIHQSPTILSSSRAGGTTGAVLWKITPLFAAWISSPANPLWKSILSSTSVIAELGTGISALVALALAPSVHHYIATDQQYVQRLFLKNVEENASVTSSSQPKGSKSKGRSATKQSPPTTAASKITFTTLDWESDDPHLLKTCMAESGSGSGSGTREKNHNHEPKNDSEENDRAEDPGFDLLLSCDCIYNEALIPPFVRTCAELCRLRPAYTPSSETVRESRRRPTVCIIAQQQRLPDVFEAWLRETLREFRVWRLRDEFLGDLKGGSGYLVHLLLVREGL